MGILGEIIGKIFHSGSASAVNPNVVANTAASQAQAPAASSQVDVSAELTAMAAKASEKLNWQTSIVDLMKLLNLDSGLASRKQLAKELGYTASTDDTATMNKWLISQVMQKLAANGGKVPAELLN